MNIKRWFLVIVLCQVVFLPLEVAHYERKLNSGTSVMLRVVPVDPRSLFQGHYILFSYDISTINLTKVAHQEPAKDFLGNKPIYVSLDNVKPYAKVVEVATKRELLKRKETVLVGQGWAWGDHGGEPKELRVSYGAERYFIPESKQEEVNRMPWQRGGRAPDIGVELSLQPDGTPLIRRVIVEGKTVGY